MRHTGQVLWLFVGAVVVLLVVGVVFDLVSRRRGAYRDAAYFKEASKQRRANRVNLLHSLYERRTGEGGGSRGRRHG